MMLLLAFLALAPMQDAPPLGDADIVVIAERLRSISVSIGRDPQGRYTCATNGTTGSPRLDDRLCRAAVACSARVGPDDAAVHACIEKRKPRLLRQIRRELEAQ